MAVSLCSRLHEVGLFTAVKQEGNYETGQVWWINIKNTLEYSSSVDYTINFDL
jgi:hypothetical protein